MPIKVTDQIRETHFGNKTFWEFQCPCNSKFELEPKQILEKNDLQCPNCGNKIDLVSLKEAIRHWLEFQKNMVVAQRSVEGNKNWRINPK